MATRVMGINGIAAVIGSLGGEDMEVPLERLVRESRNNYSATEEEVRFTIRRGVKVGVFCIKTKKGKKWVAIVRYGKKGRRK